MPGGWCSTCHRRMTLHRWPLPRPLSTGSHHRSPPVARFQTRGRGRAGCGDPTTTAAAPTPTPAATRREGIQRASGRKRYAPIVSAASLSGTTGRKYDGDGDAGDLTKKFGDPSFWEGEYFSQVCEGHRQRRPCIQRAVVSYLDGPRRATSAVTMLAMSALATNTFAPHVWTCGKRAAYEVCSVEFPPCIGRGPFLDA